MKSPDNSKGFFYNKKPPSGRQGISFPTTKKYLYDFQSGDSKYDCLKSLSKLKIGQFVSMIGQIVLMLHRLNF